MSVEDRYESDMADPGFTLPWRSTVRAGNAGLFVSRGRGRHPDRVIDTHELILVRRGCLGIAEERREFSVRSGETLLLTAGRRHFGTADYEPELSFYWLHFTLDPGRDSQPMTLTAHGRPARPEVVESHLRRFLDDQAAGVLDPAAGDALVGLILIEAGRTAPAAADDPASVLAHRAREWLIAHYHRNVSTSDVGKALDCHPDYLGRVFRRVHGHTVVEELHRLRLGDVRRALIGTTDAIDHIARTCGFGEAGYLRRIFRRHHGMSPDAWRRHHVRAHVNTE